MADNAQQQQQTQAGDEYEYTAPPHPYLHEPVLYISNLAPYVSDSDLAVVLEHCVPFRPRIARDGADTPLSGSIEFRQLDKAEKALATLQGRPIPGSSPTAFITLSAFPPDHPLPLPQPTALPRIVKQLPSNFSDSDLFDLFRPFGPLASVRTSPSAFAARDSALVEFWREEDAKAAEENMHCAEVGGQNIAVQVYHPPRKPSGATEFSPSAPPFIPSGTYSPQSSPGGYVGYPAPRRVSAPFVHGPGQQVQFAPASGPGSGSHSGLIDPCNLFCKNLDPEIDSNALFAHFRQFGQIVSARVMRDDSGRSRGFGFVSFQQPDQAALAMHSMNGLVLGSKQIVVRLHEPKQLRQEKLAQRFASGGHNNHPRSRSGATSPTASEGGDSFGWPSPRGSFQGLGSPRFGTVSVPVSTSGGVGVGGVGGAGVGAGGVGGVGGVGGGGTGQERTRRGSGSYYNAALAGQLNIPMTYDDLSALSPVVRREVLSGELHRRVKALPLDNAGTGTGTGVGTTALPPAELDSVVDTLVALSLADVVEAIQDTEKLRDRVQTLVSKPPPPSSSSGRSALPSNPAKEQPPKSTPSPASQDSRLLDPNVLNATASAPDHPSTPVSLSTSLSTPPRTSSPASSPAIAIGGGSSSSSAGSEHERLRQAVSRLEPDAGKAAAISSLIMSLSKRERAMCLFSVEVLRAKVADAKVVLESDEGEGEDEDDPPSIVPAPVTPARKTTQGSAGSIVEESPQTPDLSSRGPSAAASPAAPLTPPNKSLGSSLSTSTSTSTKESTPAYTLPTLAALPASKIISLLSSSSSSPSSSSSSSSSSSGGGGGGALLSSLGLSKPDALIVKATDELLDSLADLSVPKQKQAIGDKLFRVVKGFGIKGAPKVTIHLLDQDELRPLAHLMNSYPAVLKEKALLAQQAIAQSK